MWFSSKIRPRKSYQTQKNSHPSADKSVENKQLASGESVGCGENVREYLLNSTLHGLRYIGDTQISVFERVFFFLSFVLVICLSVYFISNIYQKWSASPIIIGLNAVATSIADIPFPAVTICNMNIARKSIVDKIKPDTIEQALVESLCQQSDDLGADAVPMPANFSGKWTLFRKFLLEASQPCDEMLMYCRFATKTEKCMELFNTVLSDDGLCCTFNSVHPMYLYQNYDATDEFDSVNNNGDLIPSDWTPEDGWSAASNLNIYPRPAAGSGSHMGLFVVLNASVNDYYCSSTNSKGFKILLHNPTETPKITDYGFAVTTGKESRVVITPRISDASRLIKTVPTNQRQCIFANEGNLSFFRTYSRKNCQMECESRIIEENCGCVQYFMPRNMEETKICSRKDYACYAKINLAIDLALNTSFQCRCLPGCFEIYYKPSMYTSTLGNGGFSMRDKFLNALPPWKLNSSVSVVHIYYEESFFRSYTKEELIGFTEFLSSTGGLLGLFMGFSMVSLIEIIYFLSLRPYCSHRRGNRHAIATNTAEPGYLHGVYDPKKSENNSILTVRPLSKLLDQSYMQKTVQSPKIGDENTISFNIWRQFKDSFLSVPHIEPQVKYIAEKRYPYTE